MSLESRDPHSTRCRRAAKMRGVNRGCLREGRGCHQAEAIKTVLQEGHLVHLVGALGYGYDCLFSFRLTCIECRCIYPIIQVDNAGGSPAL